MIRDVDPHKLARDLLGREFDDLEADEQRVLKRVASGSFTGRDADELAQGHETWSDRLADRVAEIGGSWGFIIGFGVVLVVWTTLNSGVLELMGVRPFDAYPFIFLNLILSMLAAVQAPIILMSQNRQARKDRITARHDYEVNLRTQLEILRLAHRVEKLARAAHLERNEARHTPPEA
ncbi:DUF1003 domain-containing protein [Porphyrobacter sp. ULC335]|jgi:uncharacterized membrane protein|uniref:DUF1003 domain-containing protein n=1 Tax=Porphyrobacter sp. ULC335 TaxID=2854260 RepID=UPI00221F220F|nr:DUF1003 domain-containing protein [Porphyrobacter sp. ULC335]UYV14359.1 DUF1003 domain-containing protein [Porphyrobacter sp. ULC335]